MDIFQLLTQFTGGFVNCYQGSKRFGLTLNCAISSSSGLALSGLLLNLDHHAQISIMLGCGLHEALDEVCVTLRPTLKCAVPRRSGSWLRLRWSDHHPNGSIIGLEHCPAPVLVLTPVNGDCYATHRYGLRLAPKLTGQFSRSDSLHRPPGV